jgi:chemotaxis protein CheC
MALFKKENNKKENKDLITLETLNEVLKKASYETSLKLEEFFNQQIIFTDFKIFNIEINEIPLIVGNENEEVISVLINVENELAGKIIFLTTKESGENIIRILTGKKKVNLVNKNGILTEIARGSIENLAQIFISTFISSISNLLQKTIMLSIPMISYSYKFAIINEFVYDIMESSDSLILFSAKFKIEKENIEGLFIYLPKDIKNIKIEQ